MQSLTIIKLGGSVITDKSKPLTAKKAEIRRLGREIISSKYKEKLIIAHGSGSFGHHLATKYKTAEDFKGSESLRGMVLTSDVAIVINRIVMEELIKLGMNVKSFTPASFIVAKNKKFDKGFIEPIKQTLKSNVIPVVFGDVVMDINKGFCIFSAEKVIEVLVQKLYRQYQISSIIYCTDTDGVYDNESCTIPLISRKNLNQIKSQIGKSKATDVTGGMTHKVEESLKLAIKYGLVVRIINGRRKDNLKKALTGKKVLGTGIVS